VALHRGAEPRLPQLLSGFGVKGMEDAIESPTNATLPAVDTTPVRKGERCCSDHSGFMLLVS